MLIFRKLSETRRRKKCWVINKFNFSFYTSRPSCFNVVDTLLEIQKETFSKTCDVQKNIIRHRDNVNRVSETIEDNKVHVRRKIKYNENLKVQYKHKRKRRKMKIYDLRTLFIYNDQVIIIIHS